MSKTEKWTALEKANLDAFLNEAAPADLAAQMRYGARFFKDFIKAAGAAVYRDHTSEVPAALERRVRMRLSALRRELWEYHRLLAEQETAGLDIPTTKRLTRLYGRIPKSLVGLELGERPEDGGEESESEGTPIDGSASAAGDANSAVAESQAREAAPNPFVPRKEAWEAHTTTIKFNGGYSGATVSVIQSDKQAPVTSPLPLSPPPVTETLDSSRNVIMKLNNQISTSEALRREAQALQQANDDRRRQREAARKMKGSGLFGESWEKVERSREASEVKGAATESNELAIRKIKAAAVSKPRTNPFGTLLSKLPPEKPGSSTSQTTLNWSPPASPGVSEKPEKEVKTVREPKTRMKNKKSPAQISIVHESSSDSDFDVDGGRRGRSIGGRVSGVGVSGDGRRDEDGVNSTVKNEPNNVSRSTGIRNAANMEEHDSHVTETPETRRSATRETSRDSDIRSTKRRLVSHTAQSRNGSNAPTESSSSPTTELLASQHFPDFFAGMNQFMTSVQTLYSMAGDDQQMKAALSRMVDVTTEKIRKSMDEDAS